ncbi:hypothetical protein, conserved [Babesia ovata]|uniref:Uncharacterized protein n=1 Tax=Babesia ovata TaxID=189622 RepID=A0A2H6KAL4_9APIC|nr:uncharacterized protein BOVATA_014920 [Babesia ovata]GBE59999.1 hypothetical protein, conserved [Babesia ovata]
MVSLAELSGKLGQFIGQSEAVTKAIKNGIDSIIDSDEDFKSLRNSPSSPVQSATSVSAELIDDEKLEQKIKHYEAEIASLKPKIEELKNKKMSVPDDLNKSHESHQSKLASLQKLKSLNESFESLKSPQDKPCETLLNNLCSGLEKFLGYQETSKGYTGDGIVYSDLDRLCDGVMAFLHGVLNEVKEDESVTTYNNYISGDDNKLNKVLEKLNDSVGKGRKAFQAAVSEVDQKIKNVTRPLGAIGTWRDQEYDAVSEKLADWTDSVQQLPTLPNSSFSALSHVDDKLRNKLEQHVNLILDHSDLVAVAAKVESQLKTMENDINHEVAVQLNDLQQKMIAAIAHLKKQVRDVANKHREKCISELRASFNKNIYWPIERVAYALTQVYTSLVIWISEVDGVLKTAIEQGNDVYKNLECNGKGTTLGEKCSAICGAKDTIEGVNTALSRIDGELGGWITVAENSVTQALLKVESILKEVAENGSVKNQVNQAVSRLKERTEQSCTLFKQKQLEAIGHQAKHALGTLETEVSKLLDENYEVVEQYFLSTTNGQPAGVNMQVNIHSLPHFIDPLIQVGQTVQTSGIQMSAQMGRAGVTLHANPLSHSSSLSRSINQLQQLHSQAHQFKRQLSVTNRGQRPSTLRSYVSAIKAALSDLVTALKNEIQRGVQQADKLDVNADFNTHTSQFTNAMQAASLLAGQLESLKGQSGRSSIVGISDISRELGGLMGTITSIGSDFSNVKRSIDSLAEGITSPFNSLLAAVDRDGKEARSGLKNKVQGEYFEKSDDYKTNAKESINKIKHELSTENGKLPKQTQPIHEAVAAMKSKLQELRTQLNDHVTTKLATLQKQGLADGDQTWNDTVGLQRILQEIKGIIGDETKQQNTFTKILHDAYTFHKETVRDTVDACVSSIISTLEFQCDHLKNPVLENIVQRCQSNIKLIVSEQTKMAKTQIKKEALQKLVSTKAKEFGELTELVTQQKSAIEQIINDDKRKGIKGLLKWMKGDADYKLEEISKIVPAQLQPSEHSQKFKDLSTRIQPYLDKLLDYIQLQVKFEGDHRSPTKESQLVSSIKTRLDKLLGYLIKINNVDKNRNYIFDHNSTRHLTELNDSISALSPSHFHGFHNPLLLDALRAGMDKFTEQLSRAYVNKYSGKTFDKLLVKEKNADGTDTDKDVLSTEGRNCAKVCLTILERVSYDLSKLRKECKIGGGWRGKKVCLTEMSSKKNVVNLLGDWLKKRGFTVPEDEKKQNGELKYNETFKGENIYTLLVNGSGDNHVYKDDDKTKDDGPLRTLRRHLERYYKVSHHYISAKPKAPTTVNQMLQWICGLQYNHIYDPLCKYLKQLFPKPKGDDRNYTDIPIEKLTLEVHQNTTLTPKNLTDALETLCFHSEKMLITIMGHGHADGVYAVEFSNNSLNLLYPSSASSCLDMLVDVLNRVLYQLNFIYKMCHNGPRSSGWEECWYGRHVGGSSWNCNDKQCANQECNLRPNQSSNQIATQTPTQNCDQHPKCGVKSPLQSYLEDGLQGFLPHSFKTVGCKLTCTMTNHFGKPCLTPMGFNNIGVEASHTKTGSHLFGALYYFCGTTYPLTKLCGMLNCLLRTPPKSLGDMLAFYHTFLGNYSRQKHKQIAFDKAVREANFGDESTKLDVVSIQDSKNHSEKHSQGDLFGVISCNTSKVSKNPVLPCGSYLQPITLNSVTIFSETRASNYLSWVVYTTETFLYLLIKLREECCKSCDTPGSRCYEKRCTEKCPVKYTDEKGNPSTTLNNDKHTTDCNSIVKCTNMHPTIYRYGFTFESAFDLSGKNGIEKQRSCKDFCMALERVIGQRCVLVELIHKIDDFVCTIRHPFMCTLLTLWSLSLLYLLHILVVRLDVLRILSHLRSPSSHRIAAQSLLAAVRVKALANVKYFSP